MSRLEKTKMPATGQKASKGYLDSFLDLPVPTLLALGGLLRFILILYGEHHDASHALKYTDVDYHVFTDAASFILHPSKAAEGPYASVAARYLNRDFAIGTPYDRATYRYIPLLALLLLPTSFLHISFGKFLFAGADLVAAQLLLHILVKAYKLPVRRAKLYTCATWLFNPFVANISTRGNAESILAVLVLSTLAAAKARNWNTAAVIFAVAVHFKIYPVIYATSVLAQLAKETGSVINLKQIQFGLIALTSFALLNAAMYAIWGQPFLEHSYLYHLTRLDHRHNFSFHFYEIYLSLQNTSSAASVAWYYKLVTSSFIPQMGLATFVGVLCGYHGDLAFAWFMQTFVFVLFNRVCTSQYFMWFLCLLPLILPSLALNKREGFYLIAIWAAAQIPWLYLAYNLEFLGNPVFLNLWITSITWFAINVEIARTLLAAWRPLPLS